jgi:predicted transcriptional regulator
VVNVPNLLCSDPELFLFLGVLILIEQFWTMSEQNNPISIDHITETPHLLPYAHHVGSAIIRPLDKGRTKGNAMKAMYQQTENQLVQIKEQVETLIKQAQAIHDRINISEKIYRADVGFKPLIGHTYYVYERKDSSWMISMISPDEWGLKSPFIYKASVLLLADYTWSILHEDLNPEI